ncbi:hypothetical protein QBC42DRAFT_59298 [Cladorrhinum samala]|uniref:Uncharacterized protein n=1 Tax=Cladorrhinum samala TaxID=585594 RepID=A0AAV9HSS2_9PEZI|nr:hypothetical protein QBC42DRAFT_59298 [Cladorrhinum samala]
MKMKYWSGSSLGIALGIISSGFLFFVGVAKKIISRLSLFRTLLGGLILNLLIPWGFRFIGGGVGRRFFFFFFFFFSFKMYDPQHMCLLGRPCLQICERFSSY